MLVTFRQPKEKGNPKVTSHDTLVGGRGKKGGELPGADLFIKQCKKERQKGGTGR